MSNNKTIAKNTLFLYIRMFLTMGVGLYTSRVVLNTLGIKDYGIYSIVGGIVALFGFFNSSMSAATQRYLSFDIGKQDSKKLHKTFNTTFIIHIGIAFVILLFAETIGLWYINNKLNVPKERMVAVNWIYQFSVLTSLIGVMQVPFNALLIARERMNVFAIISIADVVLKLVIVYLLLIVNYDKLILYSLLICFVAVIIALIYRIYCYTNFPESKFKIFNDKSYYKELLIYSGWNLFGNIAAVARGQGVNLVLNIFYGTIVNAAYGITMQVQSAVLSFVQNFQTAVNPQIVKQYAQGNLSQMQNLIFRSSKFSFFLLLILVLPVYLNAEFILTKWLKILPDYTVIFVKLTLIYILIDSISYSLMVAVQATGKVKIYQIVIGTFIFLNLPISYLALKLGEKPQSVFIVLIAITFLTLALRMFFVEKLLKIKPVFFLQKVIVPIFTVSTLLSVVFWLLKDFLTADSFIKFLVDSIIYIAITLSFIAFMGFDKIERRFVITFIKNKINGSSKENI